MIGYYKSELQRGIKDDQLVSNVVGNETKVVPQDKLGTIFTWVPRLAYSDAEEVKFLKDLSIVEYKWTTESCFNLEGYGANYIDLAFTGFWVGQKEFASQEELENKNAEMNNEENTQGLIANEKVTRLQENEKTVIEKLYNKTVGEESLGDPHTIIQNPNTMANRQIIKIVNTNNRVPIMATHQILGDRIKIVDKYSKFGINFVADKNGNKVSQNQVQIDEENSTYTFYLVDNQGNIKRYRMSYGSGRPNLKGFNLSNTFYVMYDANGNETSVMPAGETAPENWYDYENQRWANIVVRDNGCETYYVWIPRYMYTLDNENQKVNAKLVDLNNMWTDKENGDKQVDLNNTDYVLPEAFTWEDPENPDEKIQLSGFWMSKFKLGEGGSAISNIAGGLQTITIRNITQATDEKYTCEIYLIKNGKRIKWSDTENAYIENIAPTPLTEANYQYTNLEKGNYTVNIIVKDKTTNLQVTAITKEVNVTDDTSVNKPNLEGFNKDYTYYVVYDADGKEDSTVPLNEEAPANWYNYEGQQWANIVVRIEGNETYYTWIPRYEYALNQNEQRTYVNFIPTNQDTPDVGYQIPEAFFWEDPNDSTKKISLDGFWMSKFKLGEGVTTPSNNIYGIGNAIKVDNIATNDASYDYFVYAYSKEKDENGRSKYKYAKQITSKNNTIDNVIPGDYIVNVITKDKQGYKTNAASRDITVIETQKAYEPDLSIYNPDITYYVGTAEDGKEISYQTLNMQKPEMAVEATIIRKEDESYYKWYNYDNKANLEENPIIEATVVVREKDYDTYYKWIPRYEYSLSDDIPHRTYISVEKTEPDEGYTIPAAFTDEEGNALKGYWQQIKSVQNNITANIITTENQIILTQIVLPKNTTGKIKLTANSQIVEDFKDLEGDNFTYTDLETGKKYEVSIFAYNTDGTIAGIFVLEEKPYKVKIDMNLQNFNKNNTYYVEYDEYGNEKSDIPIGEVAPSNWYDYTERRWANIVVRDNGNETYYTWIPRYEYKIQAVNQKTSVIFIPTSQDTPDMGYKIPESFMWEDPNDSSKKIQLDGFWISKFKLGDGSTVLPKIDGGYGTITVKDITQATEKISVTENDVTIEKDKYICEMYLIKDGKRTNTEPIILKEQNYTFSGLTVGNYTVNIIVKNNDEAKLQVTAITKQVEVIDNTFANEPNLAGFDKAHTYYVEYDEVGNEKSDTLIAQAKPTNWYNYEARRWANIVVRQNGNETYYTWIPRYGYALNNIEQKTNVTFIKGTKDAPQGYTLPEAFTWEDPKDENNKIQLEGYWMSKFKLGNGATTSNITATDNTIDMSRIATNSNYTYTAYLYNNNIGEKGNKLQEKTISSGNATFSISSAGHYVVTVIAKDANGNQISAVSQDIDYGTEEQLSAIDAKGNTIQALNALNEPINVARDIMETQ